MVGVTERDGRIDGVQRTDGRMVTVGLTGAVETAEPPAPSPSSKTVSQISIR
jgi:hypothetical protein